MCLNVDNIAELLNCKEEVGYHMHNTGFASYGYTESGASAVCAYDPQRYVDVTSDYCSCSPNTIYLDIVFVVDTSDDMTIGLVGDVG